VRAASTRRLMSSMPAKLGSATVKLRSGFVQIFRHFVMINQQHHWLVSISSKNWSQKLEQKNKQQDEFLSRDSIVLVCIISQPQPARAWAAFIHSARGCKAAGLAQLVEPGRARPALPPFRALQNLRLSRRSPAAVFEWASLCALEAQAAARGHPRPLAPGRWPRHQGWRREPAPPRASSSRLSGSFGGANWSPSSFQSRMVFPARRFEGRDHPTAAPVRLEVCPWP